MFVSQVDPIYGCSYGHEHGSYGGLAGYTERFHYAAYKNGRQDESHEGFKTYVVEVGDQFLVINLHANTKDFGRINTNLHSMTMAVTNKSNGKLMYEMQCKSRSGGSGAEYLEREKPSGASGEPQLLPVGNAETQKTLRDMYAMRSLRVKAAKRVILYNPNNLDPRLRYEGGGKDPDRDMKGTYEGMSN